MDFSSNNFSGYTIVSVVAKMHQIAIIVGIGEEDLHTQLWCIIRFSHKWSICVRIDNDDVDIERSVFQAEVFPLAKVFDDFFMLLMPPEYSSFSVTW